jgi:hypothetical protein
MSSPTCSPGQIERKKNEQQILLKKKIKKHVAKHQAPRYVKAFEWQQC